MAWQRILDGDEARTARVVAREICEAMPEESTSDDAVDLAMFWAYAAGAFDDDVITSRYERATDALVARLERGFSGATLFGGLAGAGWVLAHLGDTSEILDATDDALVAAVDAWSREYELVFGLVGIGVYFLERMEHGPAATARVGLEKLIHRLLASAVPAADDTLTWPTPAALLPEPKRTHFPHGYRDLGLAHGVAGPIALLARAAALPDPIAGAREACRRGAKWLYAQRLGPHPAGLFPSALHDDGRPIDERARTAWCYGDLGIAAAGWGSALRTQDPCDGWREVALACATRDPDRCRIEDAAMCHGATGMAHLLGRYFHASGDEVFRRGARAWFARALAMRRPGDGVAGFAAPAISPLFVESTGSIALALLAATSTEEPGWDRRLLCDIAPRNET